MAETSYEHVRLRAAPISGRLVAIAIFTVLVVAVATFLNVIPYGRAVWDFVVYLDGAYRIGLGQVPHVDFMSPIGSLTLYLLYFAEHLFPHGQPFVGLHALSWLILVPPFAVLAPRIQQGWAFAGSFAVLALVVLVPHTLDPAMLSEINYAAYYNRFATGILFLTGLWFVLPKARGDGLLLGYLFAFLFLLKITAAAAMLGLVMSAVLLGRARSGALFAMLLVAGAALGIVEMASGLVSGYLHDIAAMGTYNRGKSLYRLGSAASHNWLPLAVTLAIVALAVRECYSATAIRRPVDFLRDFLAREAFAVDAALLVAVSAVAESQNTGGSGLIVAAAVLLHPSLKADRGWRVIASAVLAAVLVLPVVDMVQKRTVSALIRERQGTTDHGFAKMLPGMRVPLSTLAGADLITRLQREWMPFLKSVDDKGFDLDGDPATTSPASRAAWAISVTEAAANFQRLGYASQAQRYTTIDFADAFPRLLGLTPARGTTLGMDFMRTVPAFTEATASKYLADADGVFFRTCELHAPSNTNPETFRVVLDREFTRLPLHPCWYFYRRGR